MPDQPLDKLSPAGKVVADLNAKGSQSQRVPHDGDKEEVLRDLICGGEWNNKPIGLIAWIEADRCWRKWDRNTR